MFIDRDLVARAFAKAGEEPINEEEWNDATSNRVRLVKKFYLATLLESLASYDWTSQKKRARLDFVYTEVETLEENDKLKYFIQKEDGSFEKAYTWDAVNRTYTPAWDSTKTYYVIDNEDNLTSYAYMYPLPADCEKVVSLNDDKSYIVEGAFIFCDEINPILLYIKNGWNGHYEYEIVSGPVEEDIDKYWIKKEDGTYVKATTWDSSAIYYVIKEHDYNFYDQPVLDPTLSAYFECKLAASIALKLTGGTDKYQMLYNEAELIANKAQKKSAEQARNKTKGNPWWTDQLGLN